jgi:hypothetical protein
LRVIPPEAPPSAERLVLALGEDVAAVVLEANPAVEAGTGVGAGAPIRADRTAQGDPEPAAAALLAVPPVRVRRVLNGLVPRATTTATTITAIHMSRPSYRPFERIATRMPDRQILTLRNRDAAAENLIHASSRSPRRPDPACRALPPGGGHMVRWLRKSYDAEGSAVLDRLRQEAPRRGWTFEGRADHHTEVFDELERYPRLIPTVFGIDLPPTALRAHDVVTTTRSPTTAIPPNSCPRSTSAATSSTGSRATSGRSPGNPPRGTVAVRRHRVPGVPHRGRRHRRGRRRARRDRAGRAPPG